MADATETLALGVVQRVASLEEQLREAHEALDDMTKQAIEDRTTIRRLEARCREYESYENEVAKLLVDAGAPVVVTPLERVKWAARRLVESRPISDARVALILRIIQNARDDFKDRESWFPMVAGRFKDIEAALAQGTVIGRDDGPYHAARKIADNSRADNIISTWFYAGDDGCWRVRQEVLVAAIVEAIEEQAAIATEQKTAMLRELYNALRTVDQRVHQQINPDLGEEFMANLLGRAKKLLKGRAQ
ncbi:hypothetical protein CcrSwift_gp179 [Caulobacter phage CcrSwift]|uniref:Uncharacterized protein n=1 Tax=Caulobacter phage CcrSwift TaxID=2927984 RepID=K4K7A3_9CAUD|nr:hypothetical protein D870_gp242 [Caulobacter phage CcrSwift]AFU88497.1 hypothetical protein CcrSwift_gp179 [Caulobacter phage CcrSwift]